ncbi:polymeric immunoglobulin receptor-like, partial [Nematolebias whitei]|uniref:polymeric immunoglobulin receptor-like n=1 Tax=Nematolebias whitei TaxID=451745 RepID=UPI00189839F6
MRYVAADLLATLGGNSSPSAKDLKSILGSAGIEANKRLNKVNALQVGHARTDQEVDYYYREAGQDFTVRCSFDSDETWKIFCRENCEGENLLIKTKKDTDKKGRYRTEHSKRSFLSSPAVSVSISAVTQSDSGQYTCGLGDSLSSASFRGFRLLVVDALLDGNKDHVFFKTAGSSLTVGCRFSFSGRTKSFCRGKCEGDKILVQTDGVRAQRGPYGVGYEEGTFPVSSTIIYVTIEQLTPSDSGQYRCHLDRTIGTDSYSNFRVSVID